MGEVRLPAEVYYGAQTQRAVENFPIALAPLPPKMIQALGLVKWACASANEELGLLGKKLAPEQITALKTAALEVADGQMADQFPIDIYQTGSGTSSNMNVNEVVSNRAIELCGGDRFDMKKPIHPNDHVNMGQSTNDIFPTAIHVAGARVLRDELIPALKACADALYAKADEWADVLKIGRTHLADATPMTLGQEFGGLARQMELAAEDARNAEAALYELPAEFLHTEVRAVPHKEHLFARFGADFLYILKKLVRGNCPVAAFSDKVFPVAFKKGSIYLVAPGVHHGTDCALCALEIIRKGFQRRDGGAGLVKAHSEGFHCRDSDAKPGKGAGSAVDG